MNTKNSPRFGSAVKLRRRANALARYEAWDYAHPEPVDPGVAIAAVGFLYDLLPEAARRREDDPNFEGVRRMLDALALLDPSHG